MGDSAPELDPANFGSYRKILLLSLPLVLSQMGVMLMQVVDGVFLASYSREAIAAIGPAGVTFWIICGLCIGVVGYAGTFVAQYVGARRPQRVGAAVWQAIYLSIAGGAILAAASLPADWFFAFVGHAPEVREDEVTYFRILCYGGIPTLMSAAVAGFFSGRSDNMPVMVASVAGLLANALLDYAMIFGHWGFPRMGMAGAAWATVMGQGLGLLIFLAFFFRPVFRHQFGTWRDWPLDLRLLWRMCVYGFPNGLRNITEITAWTVFLLLIGRVDTDGLAASNIAWRVNGVAFFPIIGLSIAIAMLVGQAQGAGRPDLSRKVTRRGLLIAEIWMASLAMLMLIAPRLLLAPFFAEADQATHKLLPLCILLLRFVAIYCLVDGLNIVFMSMLTGAGDTRWMLLASGGLHVAFIAALIGLVLLGFGTLAMWTAATIFICVVSLAWVFRFRGRRWEKMRVIEHAPPDLLGSDSKADAAPAA